jgi:membrane protease YdiL (CAAX protease family)
MGFWDIFVPRTTKDKKSHSFAFLAICWIIMAAALFMYVNIPDARVPASIFVFMALGAGIAISASEMLPGKNGVGFDYVVLGKNFKFAFIIGLIFGAFVILFGSQSIVSALSTTSLLSTTFVNNLFFTGIAAPVFEELFFRFPMLYVFPFILGFFSFIPKGLTWVLGILGSSAGWAFYHVSVLGGAPESIFVVFIMGLIYAVGNLYLFRSATFSLGAHLSNNILVVLIRGVAGV